MYCSSAMSLTCGKETVYILCYYRGGDYAALFVNGEKVLDLDEAKMAALIEVLGSPDPIEELTEEEYKLDPFKEK
jgi:hypothetical protein